MALAIIFIFPMHFCHVRLRFLSLAFHLCVHSALKWRRLFSALPTKMQSVDDSHCDHQFEGAILIKFFWICCVCVVLVAFVFFFFVILQYSMGCWSFVCFSTSSQPKRLNVNSLNTQFV